MPLTPSGQAHDSYPKGMQLHPTSSGPEIPEAELQDEGNQGFGWALFRPAFPSQGQTIQFSACGSLVFATRVFSIERLREDGPVKPQIKNKEGKKRHFPCWLANNHFSPQESISLHPQC